MANAVRLVRLDEYPAISSFIDANWKKDHVYTRDKALFDWTFQNNPSWAEKGLYSISVIEHEGGGIAGMLGVIPFTLNNHGTASDACWLVNWLLVPEARKGRNGLALLDKFAKERGLDTISFGINDTIAKLYKALRWHAMPPIPRLQWINAEAPDAAEGFLAAANPGAGVDAIRSWMRRVGDVRLDDAMLPAVSLGQIDAQAWDRDGWGAWARKSIGCARNFSYLDWRYLRHPGFKYESAVVADGQSLGLVIWRVDVPFTVSHDGSKVPTGPVVRIVEFLPSSAANARQLIAHCLAAARSVGALAADFYCYNREIGLMLEAMGFLVTSAPGSVDLPNFTQPIDAGTAIRSAVKVSTRAEDTEDDGDWYWTRSDSDQDRPN